MRFSCVLVVLLGLLVCDSFVNAFTLVPSAGVEDARWHELPIRFRVNYANAPFERTEADRILREAFDVWNSIPTTVLRLEVGEETTATAEEILSGSVQENAVV